MINNLNNTKKDIFQYILDSMSNHINQEQLTILKNTLYVTFYNYDISKKETSVTIRNDIPYALMSKFLASKSASGISKNTLDNYKLTISMFLDSINKPLNEIEDDDILVYLEKYRICRHVSFSRIRNMQSALSSFFNYLLKKRYVLSNPVNQLDPIKVPKTIKKPLTDEERELLKISCKQIRDLALIEFMYSTGVRVSEAVSLNISDINFQSNDVIVYGKGSKEREVYMTPSASIYLRMYLESRNDDNEALFVSLKSPHQRLTKNAIEAILRKLGKQSNIKNVHPHRLRRTMATNALNRGMPIEQVSKLLGHSKLDTTQIYCSIDQANVKMSHRRYLAS